MGVDFGNIIRDGDSFTAKASFYQSDVDNLIGLDVNTPLGCFLTAEEAAAEGIPPFVLASMPCGTGPEFGNTSQNINIVNADIDGFELEFAYDSNFSYVRGNFATIEGRDTDNDAFLEGALFADTLFIDSGLKFPSVGLRFGSRFTIAAEFDDVNDEAEVRDSFNKTDLYLVWKPTFVAGQGLRFDFGVDNVTDEDFEIVNAGVSQPGRNPKFSVSYQRSF